jgi:hypothetical protein
VDAGCHVNQVGANRWNQYKAMIAPETNKDLLVQQMVHLEEKVWTKKETARVCEATDEAMNSGQIMGGVVVMRNTPEVRQFYKSLLELMTANKQILNDTRDASEAPEFREHRHDQSVMSVSIKSHYTRAVIIPDETYPPCTPLNWNTIRHVPFQARRMRR